MTISTRTRLASVVAIVLALALSACQEIPPGTPPEQMGANAARVAQLQIGAKYVWGGSSPAVGFDCSGLTSYAWKQAGVTIPRTSRDQYAGTTRITQDQLRPGDLVFYGENRVVSHVAMYIGDGKLMQARKPGVLAGISDFATYWASARIGYGRVIIPGGTTTTTGPRT
ncbi:MAG: hypothetical protein JWM05_3309 [Acidimicrobiales bacterium]|nr:hypothetical protein [Acidimicrobiales bacterium]